MESMLKTCQDLDYFIRPIGTDALFAMRAEGNGRAVAHSYVRWLVN